MQQRLFVYEEGNNVLISGLQIHQIILYNTLMQRRNMPKKNFYLRLQMKNDRNSS